MKGTLARARAQVERGFVLEKVQFKTTSFMPFCITVFIGMTYDRSCVRLDDLSPVRTPGDGKKTHVNTGCWIHLLCTPFLITLSLDRTKMGSAHASESEIYVCSLCNQSFSTQGSLKRNRESVQCRQSGGFSCQVCSKRFYRKDHLGRHMKVHQRCYTAIQWLVQLTRLLAYHHYLPRNTERRPCATFAPRPSLPTKC